MIPHFGFDCISLITQIRMLKRCWAIFSCAYWPYVFLLWWNVYSDLWPFLNWVAFVILSCNISLNILDTSLVIGFTNVFSQSLPLYLLNTVFHSVSVLNFDKVHLTNFLYHVFGEKLFPNSWAQRVSHVFFKNFSSFIAFI